MQRSDKTPRPRPSSSQPRKPGNRRLIEQNRKLLGKHYANKHGVGKRR